MSKFCWNCGAETDDNAAQCSFCGVFFDAVQSTPAQNDMAQNNAAQYGEPQNNQYYDQAQYVAPQFEPNQYNTYQNPPIQYDPVPAVQPKPKKNIDVKKILICGGCSAVIVAVIITVIAVLASSTGYKAMLKKVAKAYSDGDSETIMTYVSGLAYPYENYDEYSEIFSEDYKDLIDGSNYDVEDKIGTIKSVSVKIESSEKLSDSKKKSLMKDFCGDDLEDSSIMFDTNSVTDIRKVDLTVTIKGTDKTKEYTIKKAYVVKENGQWRILFTEDTKIKVPGISSEDVYYLCDC